MPYCRSYLIIFRLQNMTISSLQALQQKVILPLVAIATSGRFEWFYVFLWFHLFYRCFYFVIIYRNKTIFANQISPITGCQWIRWWRFIVVKKLPAGKSIHKTVECCMRIAPHWKQYTAAKLSWDSYQMMVSISALDSGYRQYCSRSTLMLET